MAGCRTLRAFAIGARFQIITVRWVQDWPSGDWDEEWEPHVGGQTFASREACERAIAAHSARSLPVAA